MKSLKNLVIFPLKSRKIGKIVYQEHHGSCKWWNMKSSSSSIHVFDSDLSLLSMCCLEKCLTGYFSHKGGQKRDAFLDIGISRQLKCGPFSSFLGPFFGRFKTSFHSEIISSSAIFLDGWFRQKCPYWSWHREKLWKNFTKSTIWFRYFLVMPRKLMLSYLTTNV